MMPKPKAIASLSDDKGVAATMPDSHEKNGRPRPLPGFAASEREPEASIHPTAEVSGLAQIGSGTRIWHHAQVREKAVIGQQCIVGKGVYIDTEVEIGDFVKIQNGALLYKGVRLESGVFIGPHVTFTNDRYPRAITPDGALKTEADWNLECTFVSYGASIGAGAIILPGVRIGAFAMVGAGTVVSRDVPPHTLVVGNPMSTRGYVCRCGRTLRLNSNSPSWYCETCRETYVFNT